MIKNILFDFDGVILDSMKIKGDGFKELFKDYSEENIKILEAYHYANGGTSRFEKIEYFFQKILNKEITQNEILHLADQFGKIIESKIFDQNNLITETVDFIKENYQKFNLHIVSGAEHTELNNLCNYFGLIKYFKSIEGSPTKKEILIKNILMRFNYDESETILIGDAESDLAAAQKNAISFYGYNNNNLKGNNYIYDFKQFRF